MKLWKKILLIALAATVLLQAPFIYRRYRISKIAQEVDQLNGQRTNSGDPRFKDYKGIIHVHTSLGGHSTGSFDELVSAANANDLDFVIMTEHYTDLYDTSGLTLNGFYGKTLFIGGNEIDTADSDRFLMIPGSADAANLRKMPTNAVLDKLHAENRLAFITYPEKFKSWDSNFNGDEVFSFHTQAKEANPFTLFFDLIWSYPAYPELTLATHFHRPDANLKRFDEIATRRPITMTIGADAHSNIGFHVLGDDAGNKLLGIKLDPYEMIFRVARMHVLLASGESLTRETAVEALKSGHSYIGFDSLADPSGFFFGVDNGPEIVGEELQIGSGRRLRAVSPLNCRFVLLKDGKEAFEATGTEMATNITEAGNYRVEAYLIELGTPFDAIPWIISNPIYVR